ncbi:hypothetical protein ACFZBP_25835 [Streptomyces sp. NPDC008086]
MGAATDIAPTDPQLPLSGLRRRRPGLCDVAADFSADVAPAVPE